MNETLPPELLAVLTETPELSRAYLVGGCVRDWLLGIPHKDYDIEVFGLSYEELAGALSRWGKVDLVGRSFGVVKLTMPSRQIYDFSIPRRDSKVAPGHKGFTVEFHEDITPEEAAGRRDYTINALMFDPRKKEVLDFYNGERDLGEGILRHTSAAFPEDPLRVLRGMQFASRFNLHSAPETVALAREIRQTHGELAKERIREEWFKWAEKSRTPSLGLRFLAETGWVEHYPEIAGMRGVPQDPEWHPEGDVFAHTCHCCDALAGLPEWLNAESETRITYMLAILTHDMGKAVTTHLAVKRGRERIVSPGHEEVSGALAGSFLERINAPNAIRDRVLPLVVNHMAHFNEVSDRAIRRLAKRLEPENIDGLLAIMKADSMGRPPRPAEVPETVQLLARKADELEVRAKAPEPILLGRHLVAAGYPPGRALGELLHRSYDAQLSGRFHDLPSAKEWLLKESRIALEAPVREKLEALR